MTRLKLARQPSGHQPAAEPKGSSWRLQGLPTLQRYELVGKLGHGSSGVVYEAWDTHLHRYVAIKIFNQTRSRDDLYNEAHALGQIAHPNVVTLHDLCFEAGLAYLVTDAVYGATLHRRAWVCRDWREIVGWYIQAARGVAAIHAEGFSHNDIKPANIMLAHDGEARVIDFGLCRRAGDFVAGGTDTYLAPERRASSIGHPRGDQYSLAVSIWRTLASNCHPMAVPARLWMTLRRATARAPGARFVSVQDFADKLAGIHSLHPLCAWVDQIRLLRTLGRDVPHV